MFNGIIFHQGIVKRIRKRKKGINVFIKANLKLTKKDVKTIKDKHKIKKLRNNIKLK